MDSEEASVPINVELIFGRVEIRSWLEWREDGSLVGMGSRTVYDRNGKITEHRVGPTGVELREE